MQAFRLRRHAVLVFLGIGGIVLFGGMAWATQPDPPPVPTEEGEGPLRIDALHPSEEAVTAEQLWASTLDALACIEGHGVPTIGPYPASDGFSVRYSIEATPDALDVEKQCAGDLTSLAMRFGMDRSATEAAELRALRAELQECVEASGGSIEDSGSNPDAGMAEAAHLSKGRFRPCAEAVRGGR